MSTTRHKIEIPSNDAFEERVVGKIAAYARAECLRNLGRKVVVVHRSGPHHLVRVSANNVEQPNHYGPGNIRHDGPIEACRDCAEMECP